ncbi:MAG: hypothetical protein WA432_01570 [Candidatus Babeliaceae bacterium]
MKHIKLVILMIITATNTMFGTESANLIDIKDASGKVIGKQRIIDIKDYKGHREYEEFYKDKSGTSAYTI